MLTYDPTTSLRHWPLPMARFGLNPYGNNLYRIVFAPSRRHLVCGKWPDGTDRAQYVRRYPQLGDQWIMERWLTAEEYAKVSRETWDRKFLILGPWPERGEYELCHVFELSGPDDASLEKLVAWIEMGRNTRYYNHQVFHHNDAAREKKAIGNQQEDMIRNRLSAFIGAPFSGYGGGRGTKTASIIKTAEELGLPTQAGLRSRKPRNAPKYQVSLTL